jgi:hypothetical protein
MSTSNGRPGIVVAAVATLLGSSFATRASAQPPCSNASLRGEYAFQIDGANANGPFAAVGKNTYDGKGNLSGAIVISMNGKIVRANYTGAYNLLADCTGNKWATLDVLPLTVNFDFVVDSNLREIRMIVTDSGFTVSGTARKLFNGAGQHKK